MFSPDTRFVCPTAFDKRSEAIKKWYEGAREHAFERLKKGTNALEISSDLATVVRDMIKAVFDAALRDQNCTELSYRLVLGVMGGVGRKEIYPYSDIDFVLVTDKPQDDGIKKILDQMLYPLWDSGLEVGHAVRTLQEFSKLAQQDDTVRTSAIDFEILCGNTEYAITVQKYFSQMFKSSDYKTFVAQRAEMWDQYDNAGVIYKLQPDIKQGPGGLREMHRVWWLAKLIFKIEQWRDLLALGVIDKHSLDTLYQGHAVLSSIRMAMHFVAKRRQDELRFDLQDDVAKILCITDGPMDRSAADNLLAVFYRHAKSVRGVCSQIIERVAERVNTSSNTPKTQQIDGFDLFNGFLTVRDPQQFMSHPEDILRIFRVSQKYNFRILAHARAKISQSCHLLSAIESDGMKQIGDIFSQIISDRKNAGETLDLMHQLGVLEGILPEFRMVVGLTQRDLYHVHTVDAHLVSCAKYMAELLSYGAGMHTPNHGFVIQIKEEQDYPEDIIKIAARSDRVLILVLAALLHDIGKGQNKDHSVYGAELARQIGMRFGMASEDITDTVWLVEQHLSMFRISQRRDLEDVQLIANFAEEVQTHKRLDYLYLLSFSDAKTTGPEAWNSWKHQLLRDLYARVSIALRQGVEVSSLSARALKKRQLIVGVQDNNSWGRQADRLTTRHWASHQEALLLRHIEALKAWESQGPQVIYSTGHSEDVRELVLVGSDRSGLLSDISAVFSAWGMSAESASISNTRDGIVVDTFLVRLPSNLLNNANLWTACVAELKKALTQHVNVDARLQERKKSEKRTSLGIARSKTRVDFDVDSVDSVTVVDVFTSDRIGLLYDITKAIRNAGADIIFARITTEGDRAIDAFYLISSRSKSKLTPEECKGVHEAITQSVST